MSIIVLISWFGNVLVEEFIFFNLLPFYENPYASFGRNLFVYLWNALSKFGHGGIAGVGGGGGGGEKLLT